MPNQDSQLLYRIIRGAGLLAAAPTQHPLNGEVISVIKPLADKIEQGDDYKIYESLGDIKSLWKTLLEKSIICLRYYDKREPFQWNKTTRPVVYGISDLEIYFEKYTNFEALLYGGGKYYRDHVIHVFRAWALGVDVLTNNRSYLDMISVGENADVNEFEKLSIWTIIALTHDLGYPLEVAQSIIDKTKDMMATFIVNPVVSMDLSFNGVQNNMNDFVVRFLSSKMREKDCKNSTAEGGDEQSTEKEYVSRLQPKYYFKFQKSLEKSKHGILSAIIIYKLLLYFLESDYSINEDYTFKPEDVRQYYIRREILRAMASHTCRDIYHLDMMNFAFLLIIVDDSQEWGRKRISELYVRGDTSYEYKNITPEMNKRKKIIKKTTNGIDQEIDVHACSSCDMFHIDTDDDEKIKELLGSFWKQREYYREIFRDGQDTVSRNFTYNKYSNIYCKKKDGNIEFIAEFSVSDEGSSTFFISTNSKSLYGDDFIKKVYKDCNIAEEPSATAGYYKYKVEEIKT